MSEENMNRRKCNVRGCRRRHKVALRVVTDEGPTFFLFCLEHMALARHVLEEIEASLAEARP